MYTRLYTDWNKLYELADLILHVTIVINYQDTGVDNNNNKRVANVSKKYIYIYTHIFISSS